MQLTFNEAYLFGRAGDDMRRSAWPAGDFVRLVMGTPAAVPGYTLETYVPSAEDQQANDWRKT